MRCYYERVEAEEEVTWVGLVPDFDALLFLALFALLALLVKSAQNSQKSTFDFILLYFPRDRRL